MSDERVTPPERESLKEIVYRHGWDRWKDVLFVGAALLLTALAIGATTSSVVGKPIEHNWQLTTVENPELAR